MGKQKGSELVKNKTKRYSGTDGSIKLSKYAINTGAYLGCRKIMAWASSAGTTESNYGKDYDGTLKEVFEAVVQQSEALNAYVQSLTETSLQEGCRFMVPVRCPEWDEVIRPRFEVIQHCLMHSAYHRGQVITVARNIGLTDAPNTDYMTYMLTGKINE